MSALYNYKDNENDAKNLKFAENYVLKSLENAYSAFKATYLQSKEYFKNVKEVNKFNNNNNKIVDSGEADEEEKIFNVEYNSDY